MIDGAHFILYSKDAEADRAFFRDVLKFGFIDVHDGWLIFKLPPSELAVHPSESGGAQEFYLMSDDLDAEIEMLTLNGVVCEPPTQQRWGRVTRLRLPGGGDLGIYEPRHERP